jgi:hypothetical protein
MRLILILAAVLAVAACTSRSDAYFGQVSKRVGNIVGR